MVGWLHRTVPYHVSRPGCTDDTVLPLTLAVIGGFYDIVVCLLSHGADPNGDGVMYNGVDDSTTAILHLLIDAGGDVNRESWGELPLVLPVKTLNKPGLRVLLATPSLNLDVAQDGKAPEDRVRNRYSLMDELADLIVEEVSWVRACRLPYHKRS